MIFFDDEIFINIDSAFPYLKTSESDSNSFGDIREIFKEMFYKKRF